MIPKNNLRGILCGSAVGGSENIGKQERLSSTNRRDGELHEVAAEVFICNSYSALSLLLLFQERGSGWFCRF